MSDTVNFRCECGQVSGTVPANGLHIRCGCDSCRVAELYLDQPDPGPKGISVYQILPQAITFGKGQDQLALMQVTPKGAFRWYARCCKTSLFSTATKPGLNYAALKGGAVAEAGAIGSPVASVYLKDASGHERHSGMLRIITNVLRSVLARVLAGDKSTPFFDDAGAPVSERQLMPKDMRTELLARVRSNTLGT